jgi:phosphohistidine phosphatase
VKLYLVQHGDALAKEVEADRPLSPRGHDDVRRMAVFLSGKLRPARVCHSGKTRARQTAELLAEALAPGCVIEALSGIAPKDPVVPLVGRLAELGDELLVVGHLPFLAKLATVLVTGREQSPVVDCRPGSILCLFSSGDGQWVIQWMIRPELVAG